MCYFLAISFHKVVSCLESFTGLIAELLVVILGIHGGRSEADESGFISFHKIVPCLALYHCLIIV